MAWREIIARANDHVKNTWAPARRSSSCPTALKSFVPAPPGSAERRAGRQRPRLWRVASPRRESSIPHTRPLVGDHTLEDVLQVVLRPESDQLADLRGIGNPAHH